jgi:hypothetical protein
MIRYAQEPEGRALLVSSLALILTRYTSPLQILIYQKEEEPSPAGTVIGRKNCYKEDTKFSLSREGRTAGSKVQEASIQEA